MADIRTNLEVLRPSRKRPLPGDVFALRIMGRFLHGRVISNEARAGWFDGSILSYVFRTQSESMDLPDREVLRTDNLLLPPLMTNRLPWSRGYLQTVGHLAIAPGDVLPRHCFRDTSGAYYDEFGNQLETVIEPCGDWGLGSYRTLDDDVSDALGIPRIADDH